jgi:hypothetical protein
MASRRDSLQKLDKKLKDLARKVPEGEELFAILLGLAHDSPPAASADRTATIVATTFLEHALKNALLKHFPNDISESDSKSIFEGDASPLGTFAARITTAKVLNIITQEQREDLDTIRNIRNAFAHSMTHISFEDQAIKELCLTIKATSEYWMLELPQFGGRMMFITAVGPLFFHLITYYPSRERDRMVEALRGPLPGK